MGIENMRRWPMYVVFAICIMLTLSLFNSWGLENDLRMRIAEISSQLQDCSKQQTTCMEDSLSVLEKKQEYLRRVNDLDRDNSELKEDIKIKKLDAVKHEKQLNKTLVEMEFCKTELQSLRNLQLTKSATLETLRLEKDTLTSQLADRKQKMEEMEKEIEKLRSALTTKSAVPSVRPKITPAAAPPNISPSLNNPQVNNPPLNNENPPIHEPILENNDAKEDLEDTMVNDDNFDPQLNN